MMGSQDVKLLSFLLSPVGRRVEWALKLKGVDYEYVEEDIFNKSTLLLELNPVYKKVPVLVHAQKPIAESLIILEYVDETWKQYPLLPHHPYERALARFWANFAEQKVNYQPPRLSLSYLFFSVEKNLILSFLKCFSSE